ncbi:hypothetical protein CMUS01_14459 [Colletotrichum musicola]|uniref:Uncharacterized protein n=1 Tax=Colletotrichum musicola TaxID=2175873 RepID=A0A8H6J4Q6_9PEZI|nr:hypothetical protein CMUS01_14459 [Colletotrichum musicola]
MDLKNVSSSSLDGATTPTTQLPLLPDHPTQNNPSIWGLPFRDFADNADSGNKGRELHNCGFSGVVSQN